MLPNYGWKWSNLVINMIKHGLPVFCHNAWVGMQFSVPQIEYPPEGSSKKGSHVYFLLIVAMVLLLWHQIVLLWHHVTMVASEQNLYQPIILPRKLATGSIHDYLFCYCPLVGILFEVLRIDCGPKKLACG